MELQTKMGDMAKMIQ